MNLLPPHPKYLQGLGIHSLTDPKTWDVLVKDQEGKQIGTMSSLEVEEHLDQVKTLPAMVSGKQLKKGKIERNAKPSN